MFTRANERGIQIGACFEQKHALMLSAQSRATITIIHVPDVPELIQFSDAAQLITDCRPKSARHWFRNHLLLCWEYKWNDQKNKKESAQNNQRALRPAIRVLGFK